MLILNQSRNVHRPLAAFADIVIEMTIPRGDGPTRRRTFTGVGRRLKELNSAIRLISMEPDSPIHGLEGLKHLPTSKMPGIFDPTLADETVEVETESAQAMTRRLSREEGLFVGVSSGANVVAALALILAPGIAAASFARRTTTPFDRRSPTATRLSSLPWPGPNPANASYPMTK